MGNNAYSLSEVLRVAKIHPFYDRNVEYPPGPDTIQGVLERAAADSRGPDLDAFSLLQKEDL